MNLVLAVVYDTYREKEKDKFRKLELHRRHALWVYLGLRDIDIGIFSFLSGPLTSVFCLCLSLTLCCAFFGGACAGFEPIGFSQ